MAHVNSHSSSPPTAPTSQGRSSQPTAARLPHTLPPSPSPPLRYGGALLSVTLAVLLRGLLTPLLGQQHPFIAFYPAVLVSAWYGGLGPGLVATALSVVAVAYFWLAPFHSLAVIALADWVGLALATTVMLLITGLTTSLRRTQEQLQQQVSQVQAQADALQDSQAALAQHADELAQANHALREESAARQRMEQHLRERVEELETLWNLLPISVWHAHDPAGTHITGNRAGYEMLRLPAGANTSLSASPAERPVNYSMHRLDGTAVPPEELPMQYAAAHGVTVPNTEFLYRFDDGAELYAYGTAKPLFDAHGQVRGSLGVFLDITERKQAELALQESEERLQAALAAGKLGTWRLDLTTGVLDSSATCKANFGLPPEAELPYPTLLAMIHAEDRPAMQAAVERAVTEQIDYDAEYRICWPDGGTHWIVARGRGLYNGGGTPFAMVGVTADVTARKQAELALQESEERLRHLLALLPVAVYTIKAPDGEITYFNEQAAALWGRRPQLGDPDERFCGSLRLWQPDGSPLPHDQTPMTAALTEGRSFRDLQVVIERPDSTRVVVLVNIDPIRDPDGRVIGAINVFLDITARKQAEVALQESEAQLVRELADMTRLQQISSQFLQEDKTTALYEQILEAAMAVMGAEMGSMQLLAPENSHLRLLAWRGFAPASAAFWAEVHVHAASTCGQALATGARVLASDVETCAFMAGSEDLDSYRLSGIRAVQSTPLVTRGGRIVGMISTHWRAVHEPSARELRLLDVLARQAADLIERKAADDALQESEARFRLLADSAPVLMWVNSLAGCEFVNHEYLRFTGVDAEAVRGHNWALFLHPEDHDAFVAAYGDAVAQRGRFATQFRLRRHDGVYRWMYTVGLPRVGPQGACLGYVGSVTDITDLKEAEQTLTQHAARLERLNSDLHTEIAARQQAEQHLQERVEELETLLDLLPVAVWIGHDAAGTHITGNRASYELLRMPPGSNISASAPPGEQPTHFTVHRADGTALQPAELPMQYVGTHGGVITDTEYLYRFADGTETYTYGGAKPLFNAHGQVRGSLAFLLDITARKRAEEALAQHARDLASAHADLRQVAYVSAHDLQEPVRQLGIYSQRLALRYCDALDAETQETVAFIVEGTKRMQAQFTDLMHYLEMEDPGIGITQTDCEDLFQQTLDALREPVVTSGATVTHDSLPTLDANAKHLQIVFQELLDNALKFRNSAPPQVHVWAEREAQAWRFAVRDNGLGISPQGREQLFGFFRKLHQRQQYPGTGMGLAICKKIVERHGGRIWLESTPGAGSVFYFTVSDMGGGGRK